MELVRRSILEDLTPDPYQLALYGFNMLDIEKQKLFDGIITFGNHYLRPNNLNIQMTYAIFGRGMCTTQPKAHPGDEFDRIIFKGDQLILPHHDITSFQPITDRLTSMKMVNYGN